MKFSEILKNDISNGTIIKNDVGTPAQGTTGDKKKFSEILKSDIESGEIGSGVNTSEPKKPDAAEKQGAIVDKMLDLREDAAEKREKLLSYDANAGQKKIDNLETSLENLYKRQDEVDEKIASFNGAAIHDGIIEVGKADFDERKALLNEKISMKLKDTEKNITDSLINERKTLEAAIALNPPILKKYNIDPSTFDMNAYLEWLDEHDMYLERNEEGLMYPYADGSVDDEMLQDAEALHELVKNNERKKRSETDMGAFWSGIGGFGDGISFGGLTALGDYQAKKAYEKAGLSPEDYVSPSVSNEKTMAEHPIANIAGNTVGSVIMLRGLGEAVGAITKGIKWISKAPAWVRNAINSGITFAIAGGAETGFDGGELKDVLTNAGINFVGGAVGSVSSSAVGAVGEKIIFDMKLQHKIIPEIIRGGFSSAAFAGGKVGSTYFMYPEDSRPGAEDVARDLSVAFAFGAISSGINTMKTSAQNKKYLDDLYQKMASDYKNLATANVNGKNDISGMRKFAENVISYSDAMEAYLTGKTYNAKIDGKTYSFKPNKIRLVGQDKYVKSILAELDLIRNNANAILSGVGSQSTAVTPSAYGGGTAGGGASPTAPGSPTVMTPSASVSNTPVNLPNSTTNASKPETPSSDAKPNNTVPTDNPQVYNILISSLNRKAEELGVNDRAFYDALLDVNIFNPSAEDKKLIFNEFSRVFAGNTDPLVANWLNAIRPVETSTTPTKAPATTPYNVFADSAVSAGDTFKDAKTGNTITVVRRDSDNTVVKIDTGSKTETRVVTNSQADNLAANEQFEKIGSGKAEMVENKNDLKSNGDKPSGYVGSYSGHTYTAEQERLMASLTAEQLTNAIESNAGATPNVLGIANTPLWAELERAGLVDGGVLIDAFVVDERQKRFEAEKAARIADARVENVGSTTKMSKEVLKNDSESGIIKERGATEQTNIRVEGAVRNTNPVNATKAEIEFNGGNTNARAGETISDTVNAESTRGMGEEVAAGARSKAERIQRKISEILRKSTNPRHDTSDTGRGSARLEQRETSEAFERRALNDGYRYVTFSNGKSSIAYKNAPQSEWNGNAKEAAKVLEGLGFAVVVFDGDLRSNMGGVTQITSEGATYGVGDNLTIFVSSKLDIDGLETAYHEAFHALRRSGSVKNTMLHYRMIDIISNDVDVECEAFEEFVSTIIELYSYEVKTVSIDKFLGEITEEFYSWYIGSIYANENMHSSDMLSYIKEFSDVDNIKTQLDALFTEVKTNTKSPKAGTTPKTAVGSQAPYGSNVTPQPTPEAPFASSSASNNIVPQDNNKVASAAEPAKSKSGVKSSRDTATESSRADRWSTDRVAENTESKSTVSISEIIEQISLEFGIPVSTGKVTDREASGIYKEKPETIRTRISNNLPTISHELGHHLDKKYNLNELISVDSIRVIVSEEFLDQYPDDAVNSELIAEFVRRYLKNSNEANRLCPDFYNDFVRTLSKEDLAAVNRVAKQVNEYLSYDIDKRYESSVIGAKKAKKMQKLPFAERWKKLYTGWVDKFHPLKQITDYVSEIKGGVLSGTKNAYVLATNSLNAHTIANYQVLEGFRDLNGNFVDDAKSLIECIGMVNSKDITTFDLYLKLKHALEVIGKGKRVFADEVLEDTDNIKKKITEIEKAHPEMVEAANNLYEFQYNMLKHFAVPSGIMTMKQVEYLHNEYPCYVPFYRFIKNKKGGMFAKSSFVNQGSPIMRQTGSGLDTLSHLESIIRNVEKIVKASTRNQTAAVIGSYADNVDGIGQFIEKVAPDMLPHTIDITALKENFANRLQEVVKSSDDFFAISGLMDDVFGDDVTDFTPVANESKKIISVMRGGERSYYQIHDDALFSAVAELSPQQVNGWIRVNNMIMQPMKLLITQNNPIFAATNALRDFGTAYKLSEINNPLTFVVQYAKALGGIITNSEDYKKYKAMGGGHSSELSANIENISKTLRRVAQKDMGKARRIAYSIFRHPVDTVASINDAVESIPRFMEFERTLKENGDLQKAIFNASDITTNFKRSGSSNTAKFVNSSIMFNNAAIQGLDKTFRTLTAKDPKQRNKTLLKFVLVALIGGLIRHFWNNEVDEEGYKNLSSYKKNNFYNFAIGDGIFISLPKERENAILDSLVERVLEGLSGNEEAFYDFGGYLASQLLPPMFPDTLNPVDAVHSVGGSTIFGGLLDVGFNQDFKGTPIEGAYDKYIPSNERYTDSTTKLAYALGQTKFARALDMSPKKIDHLISSYTGILGQINKALFPMNENRRDFSVGLRNKFVSDSNYSTDVLNRMYENQEKAEKAFNYSGTIDTAVEYEKNSVITSYISGMNKAIKALPDDKQRNGRAYLLKTLNSWNYGDTTSQSNMLSSFDNSVVSKDAIFTELPGSTLEWSVNKQKYVYQMTPQEYHKYISDYMAAIENARRHYGYDSVESCEKAKKAAKDYMSNYKKTVLKEKYLSKAVPESK